MRKWRSWLVIVCLLLTSCTQITGEQSDIVETVEGSFYFYNQLTSHQQKIYNEFLDGLKKVDPLIKISTADNDLIKKVSWAIVYDHPELFWYNGGYSSSNWINSTYLRPKYSCKRTEAEIKQEQIKEETEEFLNEIPSFTSDYEKVKYVFDYMVHSVEYVSDCPDNQNIYSSLVNKQSVCAGYAKGLQYLLQKLGVECLYVFGTANQTAHGWNIVKCDDQYYQVDATFGDLQISEESTIPEVLKIKYVYLCMTDEEMLASREVGTEFDLPTCTSDNLNYHDLTDCYFEEYSEQELKTSMLAALKQGLNYWEGRFSNEQAYTQALEAIRNKLYTRVALDYLNETEGITKLSSSFIRDDQHYVISCWY